MSKELYALEEIGNYVIGEIDYRVKDTSEYDTIETALKTNKRKLDLIGEILVDVSKGNYADLNDAISEIREVLL